MTIESMSNGSLLLFDLQSPINIGMLLRVAEVYHRDVLIHDPRGVLSRDGASRTISDFAVGALQRRPPTILSVQHLGSVLERNNGRLVASDSGAAAANALTFGWQPHDCIVLGNEYDGLPAAVLEAAAAVVTIPMPPGHYPKPPSASPIDPARTVPVTNQGAPSLNVATAGTVLCCLAYARAQGWLLG